MAAASSALNSLPYSSTVAQRMREARSSPCQLMRSALAAVEKGEAGWMRVGGIGVDARLMRMFSTVLKYLKLILARKSGDYSRFE
jgi:hypothetical protein